MGLSSTNILSKQDQNRPWESQRSNNCNAWGCREVSGYTDLCAAHSGSARKCKWFNACAAVLSILCFSSPVKAQVGQLGGLIHPPNNHSSSGESVNITTPSGHSCRYTAPKGPEVVVGAGLTPITVDKSLSNEPVAAIAVRIPLGRKHQNCDQIIAVEEARIKLQAAIELFQLGLISKDELQAIADNTYEILNQ